MLKLHQVNAPAPARRGASTLLLPNRRGEAATVRRMRMPIVVVSSSMQNEQQGSYEQAQQAVYGEW